MTEPFELLVKQFGLNPILALIILVIGILASYYVKTFIQDKKKQFIYNSLLALIGVALIVIVYMWPTPIKKFDHNGNGILILTIEGDDENKSIQQDLLFSLGYHSKGAFKIRAIDKSVNWSSGEDSAHKIARKIGQAANATLVIWGSKVATGKLHPRITVVDTTWYGNISSEIALDAQNLANVAIPPLLIKEPIRLIFIARGIQFYRSNLFEAATIFLKKGLDGTRIPQQEQSSILFYLGNCYYYRSFHSSDSELLLDSAIATYNLIGEADRTSSGYYNNLGNFFFDKTDYKEALKNYKYATKLNTNNAIAFNNLANAYDNLGNQDSASIYYERSIRIDRNLSLAYFNYGMMLSTQRKYDEALKRLQQCVKLKPPIPAAFLQLYHLTKKTGDYSLASSILDEAISVNPPSAELYIEKAKIAHLLNKREEAIKSLEKAIAMGYSDISVFFLLAKYLSGK